jgi:hypothetical protein
MKRGEKARAALADELRRLNSEQIETPDNLEARVRAALAANPGETWDAVLHCIARAEEGFR